MTKNGKSNVHNNKKDRKTGHTLVFGLMSFMS